MTVVMNLSTTADVKNKELRGVLDKMESTGYVYLPYIEGKDALLIGACKMIGELQQEVSNLKSQLNVIEKNI